MKERPECFIEGCKNGALLVYCEQYICGNCYMKLYREQQKQKLNQIKYILRKDEQ